MNKLKLFFWSLFGLTFSGCLFGLSKIKINEISLKTANNDTIEIEKLKGKIAKDEVKFDYLEKQMQELKQSKKYIAGIILGGCGVGSSAAMVGAALIKRHIKKLVSKKENEHNIIK